MKETHSYTQELGYSQQEFFRALAPAIDNRPFEYADGLVSFSHEQGRVTIELGEECIRRIAAIRLPYMFVTFRFYDLSDEQQTAFSKKFNLYFQRGGG